jgi:hypothetical protein
VNFNWAAVRKGSVEKGDRNGLWEKERDKKEIKFFLGVLREDISPLPT